MAGSTRPTLLTFAPMVDSETSRLILAYHDIAYDERDHLFGWASLLTMIHGGYGQVPLLYGPALRLTGPWSIAMHFDAVLPEERRLIPQTGSLAVRAKSDWKRFNGEIGADTAVFAYFHLLPERRLMSPVFAAPVPAGEARTVRIVYPWLSALFRVLLRLSRQRSKEAATRIRRIFAETDERIADGRRYLCGDRMTIGDIALAAASAPLLLPPGYGASMPPVEAMPKPVRALITELRATPTGCFVERLYAGGFTAARE